MTRPSTSWREARTPATCECTARLGLRLLTGDRAPLLPDEGLRFLAEACEQGSGFAAARGAAIMALGVQVPQNWKLALEWLAMARAGMAMCRHSGSCWRCAPIVNWPGGWRRAQAGPAKSQWQQLAASAWT